MLYCVPYSFAMPQKASQTCCKASDSGKFSFSVLPSCSSKRARYTSLCVISAMRRVWLRISAVHSFSPASASSICASAWITVTGVFSAWLADVMNSFCCCRFFTKGVTTREDIAARNTAITATPPQPCKQLPHIKRLGQVVICTCIQTGDLIVNFRLCCEQQYRCGNFLPSGSCKHTDTIHDRHHDIQSRPGKAGRL